MKLCAAMECVLCKASFPSKLKLVQHFRETHSVAKHRSRRSRVVDGGNRLTFKDFRESEDVQEEVNLVNARQPLICTHCANEFATKASFDSHTCSTQDDVHQLKHSVSCIYCGQKCKNSRGATIHQVFCEQRSSESSFKLIHYECPADDCGAIFKGQHQLLKHVKNHHTEEGITIIQSSAPPKTGNEAENPRVPNTLSVQQDEAKSPMVTVTMKPHIGKTDGLQDLSLLITPTRGIEDMSEMCNPGMLESSVLNKELSKDSASITVEECLALDGGSKGDTPAVLCVAEDGSVSQTPENLGDVDNEKTYLLITESNILSNKCLRSFKCKFCGEEFLEKVSAARHVAMNHKSDNNLTGIQIKQERGNNCDTTSIRMKEEPMDDYDCGIKRKDGYDDDEDWEFVSFQRHKKEVDIPLCKGKFEYVCKFCNRSFLSELGYQSHIRNEECKNRKFKLPRMFSCHFSRCDSSFFKLTELQKHWQVAHKYAMSSETLEFEDEKAFSSWLCSEEVKHKVRYTCDVRRRKPHRSERLMVCHRFHSLRTAAARKSSKREYSDKHNWVHKIQPCLCYARMKVYQDFDKDTCDYTGKIRVVYYYEHSHPENDVSQEEENILDHILQRNRRNRTGSFQDLKGIEKVQHRQKLEKFAKSAGKEYRSTVRSSKSSVTFKLKKKAEECANISNENESAVHVSHNLLGSDEFFDSPVEMVLDGQFDMSHEVLAGPVVTHLDTLAIFDGNKMKQDNCSESNDSDTINQCEDGDLETDDSTIVLPASAEDWQKLFQFARLRVENNDDSAVKAEASLVLPYEKVIDLISPSEQIPIFQQLWELAYPALNSEEVIQVVKINVVR